MFRRRSHDQRTMMYMVVQEIYKNLPHDAEILTYKKINGSEIDFIIKHKNKLTPIVIGERNTASLPKVYEGFIKQYGKQTKKLYKTSFSISASNMYHKKEFHTLPYYLIGMVM